MKKYSYIILFLIASLPSFAQVSGFMGKRFLIEAKTSLSFLRFFYPSAVSPQIYTEYAVSRRGSVNLSYTLNRRAQSLYLPSSLQPDNSYIVIEKDAPVTSHLLMLGYRHYYTIKAKNWSMAPMGNYIGIGLGHILSVSAKYPSSTIPYTPPTLPPNFKDNFAIKAEVGTRYVFLKKITVDYGVAFTAISFPIPNVPDLYPNPTINQIDAANISRMINVPFKLNLLTLNVGIGGLLF